MPPYENTQEMIGLMGRLVLDDGEDEPSVKNIPLPLMGVSVEGQVVDFIAEVKLSQCYKNLETTESVEAIYHFPVDQAASVCAIQAQYSDGKVVNGVIKEKQKAKEEYEQAKRQGKQANLLEAAKRDIFTLHVGNLAPGGYVKITITYVTPLKAQDDAAVFILPTCIAPRYSPAQDAANITPAVAAAAQAVAPPFSTVELFGLEIHIQFKCFSNIKSITCPTHPSATNAFTCHIQGKTANVAFTDIAMDRDLVLLVTEQQPHQPRAGIEVAEDGSLAGFVTLFPRIEFKDMAREFIFIVDRSGSMNWSGRSSALGGKSQIQQPGEALLLFLRALPPSCTFNIVGFGSTFVPLFEAPVPYNDQSLEDASRYASSMRADMGGTEIKTPLEHVLEQKLMAGVERQVFILTDGQVSNDKQVFDVIHKLCSKNNESKSRVFTLGIGSGVSRHLLEGMARAGRGTARFVEGGDADSLRSKVLGQLKQALQPALEEVSINWAFPSEPSKAAPKVPAVKTLLGYRSPSADEQPNLISPIPRMFPSFPPPVFNKERFLSFVIFDTKDIPESVTIRCNSPDGPLEVCINISDECIYHGWIAHKMAARTAITEFEDYQNHHHRGNAAGVISRPEALKLALDNSLVSEQTSFIAVLNNPVVEAGTEATEKVIPQYLPGYDEVVREASSFLVSGGSRFREAASFSMSYGIMMRKGSSMLNQRNRSMQMSRAPPPMKEVEKFQRLHARPPMVEAEQSKRSMPRTSLDDRESHLQRPGASPPLRNNVAMSLMQQVQHVQPYETTIAMKGNTESLSQVSSSASSTPSDRLLRLCLLQKADGSFSLDDRLAIAVGLTSSALNSLASATHEPESNVLDPVVFATHLAIAAMRSLFASQKDVWELHEGKALAFLASRGIAPPKYDSLIANLEKSLKK